MTQVISWPYLLFCFILGNISLTLLADAGTVPKESEKFFWRHCRHIPILILANFGVYYVIFFALYKGGTIEQIFIPLSFFIILSYTITSAAWIKLTYNTDTRILIPATTIIFGIIIGFYGLFLLIYCPVPDVGMGFYARWLWATTTYITIGWSLPLIGVSLIIFTQIYKHQLGFFNK